MSVVLRCPTCGTTQRHPGECDACAEGPVRYFCANHDPGLWLDEPVCTACGAKFGEAPKSRPRTTRPPATPASSDRRRPESWSPKPSRGVDPGAGRTPPPPRRDPEESPRPPSLADLLAELAEERGRTRYKLEEIPRAEPLPGATRGSVPIVGCLFRLLLLIIVLIALAVGGLFVLFSGAIG